jgi:hypothetical protein
MGHEDLSTTQRYVQRRYLERAMARLKAWRDTEGFFGTEKRTVIRCHVWHVASISGSPCPSTPPRRSSALRPESSTGTLHHAMRDVGSEALCSSEVLCAPQPWGLSRPDRRFGLDTNGPLEGEVLLTRRNC